MAENCAELQSQFEDCISKVMDVQFHVDEQPKELIEDQQERCTNVYKLLKGCYMVFIMTCIWYLIFH